MSYMLCFAHLPNQHLRFLFVNHLSQLKFTFIDGMVIFQISLHFDLGLHLVTQINY